MNLKSKIISTVLFENAPVINFKGQKLQRNRKSIYLVEIKLINKRIKIISIEDNLPSTRKLH